jgi:hypothetical protein
MSHTRRLQNPTECAPSTGADVFPIVSKHTQPQGRTPRVVEELQISETGMEKTDVQSPQN